MIMASFSPVAQRIIAAMLALLALLLALQLAILPLWNAVDAERQALADARFRLARMEVIVSGPPPPRPAPELLAQLVTAPDRQAAANQLARYLTSGARQRGLIIRIAPVAISDAAAGRAVLVTVEASGSADLLIAWVAEAESSNPIIRFDTLDMDAASGGTARLTGTARAIWVRGR
jgi:hypothetical protein